MAQLNYTKTFSPAKIELMALASLPPDIRENLDLMRSLTFLLKAQRQQATFVIKGQEYLRKACLQAILDALGWSNLTPEQLEANLGLLDKAWQAFTDRLMAELPAANRPSKAELDYWQRLLEEAGQVEKDKNLFDIPGSSNLSVGQMMALIRAQKLWETNLAPGDQIRITEAYIEQITEAITQEIPSTITRPLAAQQAQVVASNIFSRVDQTSFGSFALGSQASRSEVKNTISGMLQSPTLVTMVQAIPQIKEKILSQAPSSKQFEARILASGVSAAKAQQTRLAYEKSLRASAPPQTAFVKALDSFYLTQPQIQQVFAELIGETQLYREAQAPAEQKIRRFQAALAAKVDLPHKAEVAQQIYQQFEDALQKPQAKPVSTQEALEKALLPLTFSPEAAEKVYQEFKPVALAYGRGQKSLDIGLIGDPDPLPIPLPKLFVEKLAKLNQASAQANGPSLPANAYLHYCQGITVNQLRSLYVQSGIDLSQTPAAQEEIAALEKLEQMGAEKVKMPALASPLEYCQANFARQPDLILVRKETILKTAPPPQVLQDQVIKILKISPEQASSFRYVLEKSLFAGEPTQVALNKSLASLEIEPEKIQEVYPELKPIAQAYAESQLLLGITPKETLLPEIAFLPRDLSPAFFTKLSEINKQSLDQGGQAIAALAYLNYCQGIPSQRLEQLFRQAEIDLSSGSVAKAHLEAVIRLETTQVEKFPGSDLLQIDQSHLHLYQLNFAKPLYYPSLLQQRATFLNRQVELLAPGWLGWFKQPKLKWQAAWANFAVKHPRLAGFANFISSPKTFITTKLAGSLVNLGMRWATKQGLKGIIGKGLQFLGTKLASQGLGKAIGGAIGTAVGGPLGTVIGLAAGFVIDKTLGFLAKNWKKIASVLGALLALIIGLIAKVAAALPVIAIAASPLLYLLWPPLGLASFALGLVGLFKQLQGLIASKGGIGGILSQGGATIGNFLGLSTTASVPASIMLAPLAAVGVTGAGGLLYMLFLSSSFVLLPVPGTPPEGTGAGAGIVVDNPKEAHLAAAIAEFVKRNYGGEVTSNNVGFVAVALIRGGLLSVRGGIDLANHVGQYDYLQCVGFKSIVERELEVNFPNNPNAVSYLYNHPGCVEVAKQEAKVGDNAVWGPFDECPTTNYREASNLCGETIECCGHIGIITGLSGNQGVYVTAANSNYHGSIDTRLFSRENITKIIRCD